MKKNIYCAEIDNTYQPLEYDKAKRSGDYDQKRAGYYHIYDDIIVPHLSSGTTWKYIDDEEHQVDVNEATFDKEPKTNANVRFILYQDQINFIKYFVNLKIIPIYHYFDTFMDSFCMLASKIVDDQSYEAKGGELNKMDSVYTSVDVLNFKAFYKLLESDKTTNNIIDVKKRRIEVIAQKYDEDMKKKEDEQQAYQQIDQEKSPKQKVDTMVDKAKEVFENIKSKHNPVSNYDSGVGLSDAKNKMTKLLDKIETNTEDQNISRVPSVQEADEARQQAEAEEAKERENINVQSQLLNLLLYNRKLAEDVEKNGYYLEGYEDYKDLIQQIVNTAKEIHDADLAMPATSQQQADNLTQFPDIVRLNDNIVNRNRIRTYGDGNCLYYSVAIIGFTQGIQNIKNYFNGE